MNLLCWNCRGLKNLSSINMGFISSLASSKSLDFIFLSETKSQVSVLEPVFSKLGFDGCTGSNVVCNKGGLFLCRSKNVVVSVLISTKNYVCCKTADAAANEYLVMFVYGSPYISDRTEVWDNITSIMENTKGKWLFIGDFN